MTSTPSRIAWATAAAESELKQPAGPHTLYSMTQAPGAMPASGPRSTPKTGAEATGLPADGRGGVGAVAVGVAGGARVDVVALVRVVAVGEVLRRR